MTAAELAALVAANENEEPLGASEAALAIRQIVAEEIARALATAQAPPRREGMNAEEVAEFLGVDRKTVYEYANRGRIPCRKLGKRLLFSRQALVAWLGSCEAASSRKGGR
jgi:excisionase family DNA binding protein